MTLRKYLFPLQLCLAALLLHISIVAQSGGSGVPKTTSRIEVKFDKETNQVTARLKPMTITRLSQEKDLAGNFPLHQMEFEGDLVYSGVSPRAAVKAVTLRFHAVAGTYIFLKPQELIVAIDRDTNRGRAFNLGFTTYKSLSPKFNTVFEEFFDIAVPVDAVRKFAAAKTLEFYFGPIVYRFTPKQLEAIREWEKILPKEAK